MKSDVERDGPNAGCCCEEEFNRSLFLREFLSRADRRDRVQQMAVRGSVVAS